MLFRSTLIALLSYPYSLGYYSLTTLSVPVFISLLTPLPSLGLAAFISLRNLNIRITSSSTPPTSLNFRRLVYYLSLVNSVIIIFNF